MKEFNTEAEVLKELNKESKEFKSVTGIKNEKGEILLWHLVKFRGSERVALKNLGNSIDVGHPMNVEIIENCLKIDRDNKISILSTMDLKTLLTLYDNESIKSEYGFLKIEKKCGAKEYIEKDLSKSTCWFEKSENADNLLKLWVRKDNKTFNLYCPKSLRSVSRVKSYEVKKDWIEIVMYDDNIMLVSKDFKMSSGEFSKELLKEVLENVVDIDFSAEKVFSMPLHPIYKTKEKVLEFISEKKDEYYEEEILILSDSKESWVENITGFGGDCADECLITEFPIGEFVSCQYADPCHLELKRTGKYAKSNLRFFAEFEARNGVKAYFRLSHDSVCLERA